MSDMRDTFRVLTLNNIASEGLARLPRERYKVGEGVANPHAILLRSHEMHGMEIPASLCAGARAGVGVNNIPVSKLSALGIPVFNAPGANANAVKELVVATILLAARNLAAAWDYVRGLEGTDDDIARAVEALGQIQWHLRQWEGELLCLGPLALEEHKQTEAEDHHAQ